MNIKAVSVMVVHADKTETPMPPEFYVVVGERVCFRKSFTLGKDEVLAIIYDVEIKGLPTSPVRLETPPALVLYNGIEVSINWQEGAKLE